MRVAPTRRHSAMWNPFRQLPWLLMAALAVFPAILSAGSTIIVFNAIPNKILGISPFPIAASTSPGGTAVTLASTTITVCKTAHGLVTLIAMGTCSITATASGLTSVTQTFTVSKASAAGKLTAAASSPFTVGSGPFSVAAGDFNGDGKPDMAVANINANTLTIMLNNGSGGFTTSTVSVGTSPYAVVVGDFNNDGKQDLAVSNAGDGTVSVLLGNGSGGFFSIQHPVRRVLSLPPWSLAISMATASKTSQPQITAATP